ncbi:hypothetical protein MLD52_09835 [Puniceicoccaceae bacterium K14]|nr:hypothetical protein [Puniceicoccaceae bacterium K14]
MRKKNEGSAFWVALGVALLGAIILLQFEKKELGIDGIEYEFVDDSTAMVRFRLKNETKEDRNIGLRFFAETYSSDAYSSGYTLLGIQEKIFEVKASSSKEFVERFQYQRKASSPYRRVSLEIISNLVL